jgi:hypothetical protein
MVTPGTPDPGTPPSTAPDAPKPLATDTPAPGEYVGRHGTPRFGFAYSSDAATNANWDKLDGLLAGLIPEEPPAEPPPPPPPPPPLHDETR